MKRILFGLICATLVSVSVDGWSVTVMDILKVMDERGSMDSDFKARAKMTQQKGTSIKTTEATIYRRDRDGAFLIVLTSPAEDAGNGYLRMGNQFWMYRKNTRSFSMVSRDENINGTDVKGGDVERKKLVDMFKPAIDATGKEILSEEKLGAIAVYKFKIVAKVNDVTYPMQILWVRKDNYLPLKIESYSMGGDLMRTDLMLKYQQIGNKYLLVQGIFTDEYTKDRKTVMNMSDIELAPLADYYFTQSYFESKAK